MAGHVESYIHGDGRIGVLVEFRCYDSFALRTDEFRALAHDVALQIAALSPSCVGVPDLDPDILHAELSRLEHALASLPAGERKARMAEARDELEKRHCLLRQPFVKDAARTVEDLVLACSRSLRAAVTVVRFARFDASGS